MIQQNIPYGFQMFLHSGSTVGFIKMFQLLYIQQGIYYGIFHSKLHLRQSESIKTILADLFCSPQDAEGFKPRQI